ncbi:hypothetical protein LOSG293_090570 [Secundilactobacillus oryzae JCM 18671]|uniref:Uncharacterized protein n=1 Tax=Secundilactobacillus oryzae JCM 18671 TaxID=1291743 RepID=A0A081BHW4_9LACO|nr:hypothetical protein LOSG293_090570 [Secundilactobacillus oryzae JCM 18671]
MLTFLSEIRPRLIKNTKYIIRFLNIYVRTELLKPKLVAISASWYNYLNTKNSLHELRGYI